MGLKDSLDRVRVKIDALQERRIEKAEASLMKMRQKRVRMEQRAELHKAIKTEKGLLETARKEVKGDSRIKRMAGKTGTAMGDYFKRAGKNVAANIAQSFKEAAPRREEIFGHSPFKPPKKKKEPKSQKLTMKLEP